MELTYPGVWVHTDNEQDSRDISSLLLMAESKLIEATIALTYFDKIRSVTSSEFSSYQWEKDASDRKKIENEIIVLNKNISFEDLYYIVDIELKRKKWRDGKIPNSYKHQIPFIYAQIFLSSIDTICKTIESISKLNSAPQVVEDILNDIDILLPKIKKIRNTTQHLEERVVKKGPYGKKIKLRPINNGVIKSDGGVLILNSLCDNNFGQTLDDGSFAEIKVDIHTLVHVRDAIQKTINCFQWHGPRRHIPS